MPGEVVIIGAGPAGSVAALLLARSGWSVTIIEQHRFPRDKVCGECISALGIDVLERIGMLHRLQRLEPVSLSHAAIHAPNGCSAKIPLPAPMWGLSRGALDAFLLDAARADGANVLQPARCESIDPGPPIRLRVRDLQNNQIVWLSPRHAIIADGRGALPTAPPPPTADFGIKAHFINVKGPRNMIELFGCDRLYGGLVAIESDRWNAAFSVPASRLRRHRGNIQSLFAQITSENRILARRLAGAGRVSDWLAAPVPRFPMAGHWHDGIISVGNAAAAIEPIGGEGMGLAMRSAEIAAEAMINAESPRPFSFPDGEFRRLWRFRRPFCRLTASAVSRPALSAVLLPLLKSFPSITRGAMTLVGK